MEFALSPEQQMIRDGFARALADACDLDMLRAATARSQAGEDPTDPGLLRLMTEMGLYGLMVPVAEDGAGLGLFEAAVVAAELGRAAAPVPFAASAVMAAIAFRRAKGGPKTGLLRELAQGRLRIGVSTDWRLLGGKTLFGTTGHVLDGMAADAFIVTDDNGFIYLVEADAPGVEVEPVKGLDGTTPVVRLRLQGVQAKRITGNAEVVLAMRDAGRVILAAQSLGAAERMLEKAVAYAQERHQFGRPIGSFQAVKHMCAEMAAELQPCTALVWYAAYAFDHLPGEARLQACLAKSHVDEVARFVARTATEVHGGMGFSDLLGLHHWYKRIGFNRVELGAPETLRAEAADMQQL